MVPVPARGTRRRRHGQSTMVGCTRSSFRLRCVHRTRPDSAWVCDNQSRFCTVAACRSFLAGATGVIGVQLVPQLLNAGHEVTAMTRSVPSAAQLEAVGADPVVCDVFDADGFRTAMAAAAPDAVIHQLTSLPTRLDWGNANLFEENNRVRTEGTRILVDAALATGTRRIVAQSIAFVYAPTGDHVKAEDAALFTDAPPRSAARSRRSSSMSSESPAPPGSRASCCATGCSTAPASTTTGVAQRRPTSSPPACHSSRAPPACTAGCTSTMRRQRQLRTRARCAGDLQRRRRRSGAAAGVAARPRTGAGRRSTHSSGNAATSLYARRCRCAAPRTPRPSGSSDGGRGTRAGARASRQASREPTRSLPKRGQLLAEASQRVEAQERSPAHPSHAQRGQLGRGGRLRQARDVHRAASLGRRSGAAHPPPTGRSDTRSRRRPRGRRCARRNAFGNECRLRPGPPPARTGPKKTSTRALITSPYPASVAASRTPPSHAACASGSRSAPWVVGVLEIAAGGPGVPQRRDQLGRAPSRSRPRRRPSPAPRPPRRSARPRRASRRPALRGPRSRAPRPRPRCLVATTGSPAATTACAVATSHTFGQQERVAGAVQRPQQIASAPADSVSVLRAHVGEPTPPAIMLGADARRPPAIAGCSTVQRARRARTARRGRACGQEPVLVLRGEAGVGKTALLRHLSAAADGCRVARAAGVESEMELAFAGLHALCAPLLGPPRAAARPAARRAEHGVRPERRAAAGSVPRRPGGPEPAGRRRRGAAARVHRRRRAVARPGVRADARVRRAPAAGGAGRAGVRGARLRRRRTCSTGLPELVIEGLPADDARALLDAAIPGPLDERVRAADPRRDRAATRSP